MPTITQRVYVDASVFGDECSVGLISGSFECQFDLHVGDVFHFNFSNGGFLTESGTIFYDWPLIEQRSIHMFKDHTELHISLADINFSTVNDAKTFIYRTNEIFDFQSSVY